MAFEVGKREKIFVGVVALVLSIAALHLAIFMERHSYLASSLSKYEEAKQMLPPGATPANSQQVIATYEAETKRLQEQYASVYQPMNLDLNAVVWWPPMEAFMKGANQYPYTGEDVVEQELTKGLKALIQFKNENASMKLTFLGADSPTGWHIPETLPPAIQRGQINLNDLVAAIIEDNNMLNHLNPERVETVSRLWSSYQSRLVQLTDTPAEKWVLLTTELGEVLYQLKMLAHIDLVMAELSKSGSKVTRATLRRALRLQLNPIESYHISRQLEALLEVLRTAKEAGVEEVPRVKLESHKKLVYDAAWSQGTGGAAPPTPAATTPATPAPAAPAAAPKRGGYGGYNYGGYSYGTGAAGYAAGSVAMGMSEQEVGDAMPFEIDFLGSNQSVSDCLYKIISSPRSFDIEQLALGGMPVVKQAGKILARATVTVLTLSTVVQKP